MTPHSTITTQQQLMSERHAKILQQRPDNDLSSLFASSLDPEIVGSRNCENLIGSIEIPVGIAGPVSVSLEGFAEDWLLPLATTEAALVASINRGCKAIRESGSCQVFVKKSGMTRAPVFRCRDGLAATEFVHWLDTHIQEFARIAESTSNHLRFLSHTTWVRGREVFVRFAFDTQEAMGMNMVSIAIDTAWDELQAQVPDVTMVSLSSNVCTDKKDSMVNRLLGRGYQVHAEVFLSDDAVHQILKTTPKAMLNTHVSKNLIGSNIAGSLSQNMHAGNAIAALLLATGQDPAHVTDMSQCSTVIEPEENGIYVAVDLPAVIVGSVGGGTQLPAQLQARNLITQDQHTTAKQLAAAIGVAILAGEISGIAALASHSLAKAHHRLARQTQSQGTA